jgi:hypothetical protein
MSKAPLFAPIIIRLSLITYILASSLPLPVGRRSHITLSSYRDDIHDAADPEQVTSFATRARDDFVFCPGLRAWGNIRKNTHVFEKYIGSADSLRPNEAHCVWSQCDVQLLMCILLFGLLWYEVVGVVQLYNDHSPHRCSCFTELMRDSF